MTKKSSRPSVSRVRVLFYTSVVFSAGCATEGGSAPPPASVHVSVVSSSAGLGWSYGPTTGLVVKVGDYEGTNNTFSWPPSVLADKDRLTALYSCLDGVRLSVRFADPEATAQPHLVRSAAVRCFESSGMPAYVSQHDSDAREYVVELSTGNSNDPSQPADAVRVAARGGPYLGARRRVRTTAADPAAVFHDAMECKDQATAGGVFTRTQMNSTPDSAGMQMGWGQTTILPMLGRFDRCLSNRGYVVEDDRDSAER